MNVISISTDRNIFKEGSVARVRQVEYGTLFSETHIIIFSRVKEHDVLTVQKISPNVWIHPTNSRSKIGCIKDAFKIARDIISERGFLPRNTVVTTQDPFETALVGTKLKKSFGLPLHIQIHTDVFSPYFAKFSWLNSLRVWLSKKALLQANAIRVVSKRISDSLEDKENFSGARNKIVQPIVLPIFVDKEKFGTVLNTVNEIDLHKKYPQFDLIVLMATRLSPEKNISLGIEAFSAAAENLAKSQQNGARKIGLLIVGEGREKESLVSLAKKLRIEKSIIFEPWQEDKKKLADYYKSADIFLSTSWYEGYGLSMVEATICGSKVVATDVGVARELTNLVSPPGDKNALIDNLTAAFTDNSREYKTLQVKLQTKQEYLESYRESLSFAFDG